MIKVLPVYFNTKKSCEDFKPNQEIFDWIKSFDKAIVAYKFGSIKGTNKIKKEVEDIWGNISNVDYVAYAVDINDLFSYIEDLFKTQVLKHKNKFTHFIWFTDNVSLSDITDIINVVESSFDKGERIALFKPNTDDDFPEYGIAHIVSYQFLPQEYIIGKHESSITIQS